MLALQMHVQVRKLDRKLQTMTDILVKVLLALPR